MGVPPDFGGSDSGGNGALRDDQDCADCGCAGIAESVTGTGVTVNSILAGPTESEGVGALAEAMAKQENKSKAEVEKQFFEHVRPSSLLKRFATVDEVAAMATYLAGKVSSATNGAALRVDGGVVRAIL
jgi:NAD(P)-dependent dehydrogenase (short-subunit alcohol dehydrogenase family)